MIYIFLWLTSLPTDVTVGLGLVGTGGADFGRPSGTGCSVIDTYYNK